MLFLVVGRGMAAVGEHNTLAHDQGNIVGMVRAEEVVSTLAAPDGRYRVAVYA